MALPEKKPLHPGRVRQLPPHFSWIDRRFFRGGASQGLAPDALALYFFLLAAADKLGLSFYSDRRICQLLSLDHERLLAARQDLLRADLVAYRYPLYQVLELPLPPPFPPAATARPPPALQSLGEILRQFLPPPSPPSPERNQP